jgi:uncharacterized linocin/CFP29 family protein
MQSEPKETTMTSAASTTMAASKTKRASFWGGDGGTVWSRIDVGVNETVQGVRVVQNVIAGAHVPGMSVPYEELNPDELSFAEGRTKPYIELAVEFSITNGQVMDPTGAAAIKLAKFSARDLAIAEDLVFLQGEDAMLPPTVRIESGRDALGKGILGLVADSHRVSVPRSHDSIESGAGVLQAVMRGIAILIGASQSGPYYIIQDMESYAATFGTVVNGNPTNEVLRTALVGGAIYPSTAMPARTSLLIATGGDPTTIYVDTDPTTEPTHQGGTGRYHFRTFERVQYVASDRRAFVALDFPKPTTKK